MQVSIKAKGKDRPSVKVGDRVQFNIGEEVYTDTVSRVDGNVIEGDRYDLTHINFTIIKE